MAWDTEDLLCWQCSNYLNVFPEFMASIRYLKGKKKKTDEDNIIHEVITKGNTDITDKTIINDIFDYAVGMSYISKSTYKDHNTYKINLEISEKIICKTCGEDVVPFDCNTYDVNPEIKYVDMKTFEQLAQEINDIKKYLSDICKTNSTSQENLDITEINYKKLQLEVTKLLDECEKKDKIINILTEKLTTAIKPKETNNDKIMTKDDFNTYMNKWRSVKYRGSSIFN